MADRYAIQRVLGVGGMGSVYRARDLHFPTVEKFVAAKEILNQAPDPELRLTIIHNFEREAGILATLDHPSIPTIFDYFSVDDRSYLILEYINGSDLESVINEASGFLQEEKVMNWAIELCDVLNYLHTHLPDPIIFRDIKPSNIMIDVHGKVILVDFGIAKTFQSGGKGTMIGTEGYSPPEQYRGEATPFVDIYALGATLHHALTRLDPRLEAPFSFGERKIREINPALEPELEEIITKALQYNPEDRYASAAAMKTALVNLSQKNKVGDRKLNPIKTQTHDGVKPVWSFQSQDEIRGSPTIYEDKLFFGSYDHSLYSLQSSNGSLIWQYTSEAGLVSKPAIEGGDIYIGSEDQRLHVVSMRTGKISWSYYTGGRIRSSPKIAEGHVFIGSDDARLHAINIASGRAIWQFEATSPIRSTPLITSEMIYFGCDNGEFYALDFRGELIWNFKAKLGITSSPCMVGKSVYFCSHDSNVYALDSRAGWVNWRFRMGKGSVSSPCVHDGLLFTGSADGNIYAIDSNNAKEIWRFKTDYQVSGSPVIYKDELFCGTADGFLYCLETTTGHLRWKFSTSGAITSTPAINDEFVFIGSTDHCLYALPNYV